MVIKRAAKTLAALVVLTSVRYGVILMVIPKETGGVIMASVKTAISLKQSLLEQVDALAQELNLSRSHLFALAAEEFIQHHRNQELLEKINSAYDDFPDSEESVVRQKARRKHRQLVAERW